MQAGNAVDLQQLIEVRPPYFALRELAAERPGRVRAVVWPEQPRGRELGPMAAAEVGRHLAILGSCACASMKPEDGKHFYLARAAKLERAHGASSTARAPFIAEGIATSRSRRDATARCSLTGADGAPVYSLAVSYQVLSDRLFERMFRDRRREMRSRPRSESASAAELRRALATRRNPYAEGLPLEELSVDAARASARLARVPGALCSGHFPRYPAMPVAFLMYGLARLAGRVQQARHGEGARYWVDTADVRAERLAFAEDTLIFEACWRGREGGRDHFETRAALDDGTVVGEMALVLGFDVSLG